MKRYIPNYGIEGMARVGVIDDTYEIYVNSDHPGRIPHFHFRNKKDWSKFHTCIRIDVPEYFTHGDKHDILNSKMKKELQDFMMSKPEKRGQYKTNWDYICDLWDDNNSDSTIGDDVVQPDYTKL